MELNGVAWTAVGFVAGSIPFAVLVGRLVAGTDVRGVADGNPGATNAFRAAGRVAGIVSLALDVSKGVAPVALAILVGGVDGWWLAPVMVAPVIGHCFSPWLGFRGGKGVATAYGVLLPVSLPLGLVLMPALLVVAYVLVEPDGWAPVLAGAATLGYLLVGGATTPLLVGAALTVGLVAFRHRGDLVAAPRRRRRAVRA